MARPKAMVLRAAGTNCDKESQYALELAGFEAKRVHVFRVTENPALLDEYQLLMIPGGFSYGDDVSAGKILANQMIHHLAGALNRFVADGKLVLGVCNGFQVLLKSGLLPCGAADPTQANRDATLTWNDCGIFVDRWINLCADSDKCVFLTKGRTLSLPIAHGEGKFVTSDDAVLGRIRDGGQVAVRYDGGNPNGSIDDIAGICDPTGRIFGLMPHPERFVDPTQHPTWTRRRKDCTGADGLVIFKNAAKYLK
ncbi:MAG: phosphoribosylformylglycinamidine synthase subunit PurQ [Planctomycetota bacterium]|nr:phosphoribosylformylglycinamidine synthase subunit PurQ [Planctomycetota bacterium]